jgi:hypothetical protein
MDRDVLKSGVEAFLTGTVRQYLHQQVMTALSPTDNSTLTGTLRYSQERLLLKALSTGVMYAGFVVMSILCVVLLFALPRKMDAKGDVGSTLTVANVLLSSPSLASCVSRVI